MEIEGNLEKIQNEEKIKNKNGIFLIQNVCNYEPNLAMDDKVCEYCKSNFFSKYNKERHIKNMHTKKDPKKNDKIDGNGKSNSIVKFVTNNFIGNKHHIMEDSNFHENSGKSNILTKNSIENKNVILKKWNKEIDNQNIKEGSLKNSDKNDKNGLTHLYKIPHKFASEAINIDKRDEFFIGSKGAKEKSNVTDIIKLNLYDILRNNKYVSLGNYFLFKDLIIGNGKFGTVFFGINIPTARAVAIKASNGEKRNSSLKTEIIMMKKLSKYKVFCKFYQKFLLDDRVFIAETLQGPSLYKLRRFCGGKFSLLTVYRIGIEIIQSLKLIHKLGYIYLDIKDDNIALLSKPIISKNISTHITLIDYGFCEKYDKKEENSPRIHGNITFSSINALGGHPVSRKDDIISLCYFLVDLYLGSLPWDNISGDCNKIDEVIKLKQLYPLKKFCGNNAKEIQFIFDGANCLQFDESPKYENYIYLLENYIKIQTGKIQDDILFDWDKKLVELVQNDNGAKNYLQDNEMIGKLFEGYPDFYVDNFIQTYWDKK